MPSQPLGSLIQVESVGKATVARFSEPVILTGEKAEAGGKELLRLAENPDQGRLVVNFANVQNLFDERYSTFGLLSDPTGLGAPGIPAGAPANDPRVDNRFQSPAMPRSYFGGIRFSF